MADDTGETTRLTPRLAAVVATLATLDPELQDAIAGMLSDALDEMFAQRFEPTDEERAALEETMRRAERGEADPGAPLLALLGRPSGTN